MSVGRNRAERDYAERTLPRTMETHGEGLSVQCRSAALRPTSRAGFPPPEGYFCGQ
jgi:hypothetical protein